MDPRRNNECLKREHFEISRRKDIGAEPTNATVFWKTGRASSVHQILLRDETRRVRIFVTHTDFGVSHFNWNLHPQRSSARCLKFSMDYWEYGCTSITCCFGALRHESMMSTYDPLCRLCAGSTWRSTYRECPILNSGSSFSWARSQQKRYPKWQGTLTIRGGKRDM